MTKRSLVYLAVAIAFLLPGCDDGLGPWQEQLIAFGEGEATVASVHRAWSMVYYLDENLHVVDSQYVYVSKQTAVHQPFQERINVLHEGDIKQWEVVSETKLKCIEKIPTHAKWLRIQCIQLLTESEWKKQLMDLVQTGELTEEKAIEYFSQENFEEKRPGLAWHWLRKGTQSPIQDSAEVITHIGTTLLNGQSVGRSFTLQAKKGQPDQWAPAVQWVLKYLADGDSVEIIAKSDFAFSTQGSAALGIPGQTPLIFHLGVRSIQ